MKKYLVPLLVLVLLLVSVTTVFADRFSHAYNDQGICTFDYQIYQIGSYSCESFYFDGGSIDKWSRNCIADVNITEKSTHLPYTPIQDSIWRCQVKGTSSRYPPCGIPFDCIYLEEVLLIEDITPP
jgi:hypothetical protein